MPAPDSPPPAKPLLVVLTGAGMSAESGIPTFRGMGGLWESHRIEDVATPEGWARTVFSVFSDGLKTKAGTG
jgi:NAD-dependent deacetylase